MAVCPAVDPLWSGSKQHTHARKNKYKKKNNSNNKNEIMKTQRNKSIGREKHDAQNFEIQK